MDHSTIARWVLHFSPILNDLIGHEMRRPNRSWRVDETYVRLAGRRPIYIERSTRPGILIDFLLSPNHDLTAAKGFLRLASVQRQSRRASSMLMATRYMQPPSPN